MSTKQGSGQGEHDGLKLKLSRQITTSGIPSARIAPGAQLQIPVFQIFAVGAAFSVLSNASYWTFIITQQNQQLMRYNFVEKPLVILLVFVGSYYVLIGVAIGNGIGLAISLPTNLIW